MVKILIVYDSRSGNTEKMASAVADGAKEIKGVEVIVKKVDQTSIDDALCADGLIMGSPTYYGQMSGKLKAFIDSTVKVHGKLEGRVGAAFTSAGGTATGAETTLLSILETMLVHGMIIQGRSDDKHFGATAVGAPNAKETEYCKELGRRIAERLIHPA
jgi:NAD(P)H dehydrogenase (quinone)